MQNFSTPIATRPAYVAANPAHKGEHRIAQKAMFGAAKGAGLGTTDAHRDAMLDGINAAFGLRGSQRIVSRRQMTIAEQYAIATAVESGLFEGDWKWNADFHISRCEVQTTIIPARTLTRTVLHIAFGDDSKTELYAL